MNKENLIKFIEQVIPIPRQRVEEIAEHFQPMHIGKNEYFIEAEFLSK